MIDLMVKQLFNITSLFTQSFQNGDYELDYKSYKLLFSNFLLGRTIYGPGKDVLSTKTDQTEPSCPGKYIFGCFDNRDMNEPYKIVYDM